MKHLPSYATISNEDCERCRFAYAAPNRPSVTIIHHTRMCVVHRDEYRNTITMVLTNRKPFNRVRMYKGT
jgi:hypothetical protein